MTNGEFLDKKKCDNVALFLLQMEYFICNPVEKKTAINVLIKKTVYFFSAIKCCKSVAQFENSVAHSAKSVTFYHEKCNFSEQKV